MLEKWSSKWGMKFNPSKCEILNIARTEPQSNLYELCGEFLKTVESAKYLGIIISKNLDWYEQVSSVAKKANCALSLIVRNLHNCSRHTRALAYTSLVRPKMEYSACVWDPHQQKDIDTLERTNRRATRVVYKKSFWDKDVSPTNLLRELQWPTLAERRQHQRLTMMYKISHGLIAIPPTQLTQPSRQLRGHSKKYKTIRTSCDIVKNSFYPRTIPQWNTLTEDIVSASSVDSFKAKLLFFS